MIHFWHNDEENFFSLFNIIKFQADRIPGNRMIIISRQKIRYFGNYWFSWCMHIYTHLLILNHSEWSWRWWWGWWGWRWYIYIINICYWAENICHVNMMIRYERKRYEDDEKKLISTSKGKKIRKVWEERRKFWIKF